MPVNVEDWEQIAEWYDHKQGDGGDLWHRALIDPAVFRALGAVSGQRVLDLACGNGYLARRLARQGAQVTAVDASAPIIARARAREQQEPLGITYHVADAVHLGILADGSFDAVLCNMGLMDIADAEGAIREVGRVLRPQGRFIASLCHPCFDLETASAWVVEKAGPTTTVWRKVSRYREVFEEQCTWNVGPGAVWRTRIYHRPLSWYVRALRAAGLLLAALEEPEPTEELLAQDDEGQWIAQVPLHCVIEAWKLAETHA
ncbi:MAG: class I SAM-dependent methyltransferase [Chloroflexi bacterium]|nr:class I SAM-dependent methyltransferase [Chloroflexota bacterium]